MTPPLLTTQGLMVGHHGTGLLPPLDLTVQPEEFWAVVGRNGSGKTTLLRTLLGLLPAVQGRLHRTSAVGYIAQRSAIDLSVPARVIDMVREGLDHHHSFLRPLPRQSQAQVNAVLQEVNIQALRLRPYQELSEGQKQRVLLARALVANPALLVLDEPTSAMDMVTEANTLALLKRLRRERHLGILVVGHHLAALAACATHLLVVDADDTLALAGPLREVAGRRPCAHCLVTSCITRRQHMNESTTLSSFFAAWELFADAAMAGALTGALLGFLGVYVVLRRIVFLSAALSQAAGLGVTLAFYAQIYWAWGAFWRHLR